jgi:transcriptional regulator with XRE-family HTH domain
MKIHNYDDMLKEQLKNPAFRKEYDALEEEFEVAKQVIELRLQQKMTQKELAKKVQTSQSCIARLESGTYRNLSLSFLRRVGGALGVQPHVVFQKGHFRSTPQKKRKIEAQR